LFYKVLHNEAGSLRERKKNQKTNYVSESVLVDDLLQLFPRQQILFYENSEQEPF